MKKVLDKEQLTQEILRLYKSSGSISDEQMRDQLDHIIEKSMFDLADEESRSVTILLSDLRGFTALSEKFSAYQVIQMLNNYFSYMNKIIKEYGGMIDKYMGDAVMVIFGLPQEKPDDAIRAVACAIEMQNAMEQVNRDNREKGFPDLFAGIGINTDFVSAGDIGSDIHSEFTVIGDGVNLASRIEAYSLRGQILISQNTYEIIKDAVEVGNINHVSVKGKSEPVNLYEVTGLTLDGRQLKTRKKDVRNSVRLEMDAPFLFQRLEGKEILSEQYHGVVKDMSYNGLFAVVEQAIEPMTNIRFTLALSLIGGHTRDIYAKVVSVRKVEGGFGCGIEFTTLDNESQQSIKSFIDRVIHGR